jgi:uncharacterized protein (TIGR00251 family)
METAGKGVIFSARVKAGSGSFSIEREKPAPPASSSDPDSCVLVIHTKSPPEGNKANMEIVKELTRLFARDVRILHGLKSRRKEILVEGISPEDVARLISSR